MSNIYDKVKLNLGDKTYSNMNTSKDAWGLLRNTNQVYVNVNNMDKSDLLQFPYDPNRKQFCIGKVRAQQDSSTTEGAISEQTVYVPIVTGSSSSTGGIQDDDDVSTIVEGTGIIVDNSNPKNPRVSVNTSLIATRQFVLDTLSQTGGSGGGDITINGVTSIGQGTGIIVNNSDSNNPIISVNTSLMATRDYVLEITKNSGTGTTATNLDNPDYAALLELLNVMEVQYEDEPIQSVNLSSATSDNLHVTKGFRFQCSITETQFSANCIRWKNYNTGGNRYDGDVFLKIIEYDPITGQETSIGYGAVGEKILTVSSNSINQTRRNTQDEWYEWYFPKQINFKSSFIYVIIPHHDKSYESVTTSEAKVVVFGTSDTNTSTQAVNGMWTSDRQDIANVTNQTPIIQFCQKKPTTILMKR